MPPNASLQPLVVVTGGLGRIGAVIGPALAGSARIRVVDQATSPPQFAAELVCGDLSDPRTADRALDGADAVVHLAGLGDPRAGWEEVYRANIVTTRHVLEAAERHGVRRIVLAGSVHAMGEYNRPATRPVDPARPPRPCCAYGLSKVAVELLGRLHAERTAASVVVLRLGLTGWPLTERRYLGMWLSDRDAAHAVLASLTAPPGFGAHFAVSANTRRHWDTGSATSAFGYRPRDDSEIWAAVTGPPAEHVCRLFGPAEDPPRPSRYDRNPR
ncbi:NAD(P)-dependent oxidoreductase [Amycolatopsis sp. PS_44_ISF1]|uniref:NAD-dependent epimerase/dehydratase family protein n=1 Tax=Amycolatopsis sp. PS_44_ISF1 TaxID=2974917 RepID=UPI0028DD88B8|nr:NAD(P)-dependent oxidoreductase [Amycolatopsis sp. PS_44_ISF1]MDT8913636.1 NAD(P)-dependent oxidoreductase [Amycolatopsis sp. PS_44_ISF1]